MTNEDSGRKLLDFNVIKAMKQKINNSKPIEKEMFEEVLREYKKGNLELSLENNQLFAKIPGFNKNRNISIDSMFGEVGTPLEKIK